MDLFKTGYDIFYFEVKTASTRGQIEAGFREGWHRVA
jgi:hypothetical protein